MSSTDWLQWTAIAVIAVVVVVMLFGRVRR